MTLACDAERGKMGLELELVTLSGGAVLDEVAILEDGKDLVKFFCSVPGRRVLFVVVGNLLVTGKAKRVRSAVGLASAVRRLILGARTSFRFNGWGWEATTDSCDICTAADGAGGLISRS